MTKQMIDEIELHFQKQDKRFQMFYIVLYVYMYTEKKIFLILINTFINLFAYSIM